MRSPIYSYRTCSRTRRGCEAPCSAKTSPGCAAEAFDGSLCGIIPAEGAAEMMSSGCGRRGRFQCRRLMGSVLNGLDGGREGAPHTKRSPLCLGALDWLCAHKLAPHVFFVGATSEIYLADA